MILPTIHSNGTSRSALFDGYAEAIVAIDFAIQAIRETAPHGRDYYPISPDAFTQAREDHLVRLATLEKISEQLQTLAEHAS